ncbi:hypothetical protein M2132_001348 [Dysgonomonas sp. PH5-45]|uniref:hypothetical protein n=1 Tax=unclassified Dysgonomonas TaxID=2630389 RepID=UPI0024756BD0|nr:MULTISPECIES: hypothetical protein [unclassified Dysgonomonas]MDH6355011.1 hypothetical protein [Dysgonomonas sp. PH5-45]MDH6387864.1 hypothetical protein [Dysgonomonas sp. PH5-37]
MMKNISVCLLFIILFSACASGPRNFTCLYDGKDTGLENRININGCYVSPMGCDSSFFSVYMFYPDGLFCIATTSYVSEDLIACFAEGGTSSLCRYPIWGTYRLAGDTIKTQAIRTDGGGFVVFRDYRILDGGIVNISDYVQPRYSNLGYMANYPSFTDNPCPKVARFYPLASRRDATDCPFFRKSWFRTPN